jgi:hypothetical protein
MATMMRCTVAHWRGDTFVPAGTILAEGDPQVIPEFFEALAIVEPTAKKKAADK